MGLWPRRAAFGEMGARLPAGISSRSLSARLLAELTDSDGKALAGFGRNECQLGKQVGLEYGLTWKEGDLQRLKGKDVCLRVAMTKAELYAVEVG